jgi:uncharacterized protein (DUF433 family)
MRDQRDFIVERRWLVASTSTVGAAAPRELPQMSEVRRLRVHIAAEPRYPHSIMDPKKIVHSDPEILGGAPVFVGTRVPVDALVDFLEGGDTIEEFLENYPGVSREQVFAFLEEASRALLAEIA